MVKIITIKQLFLICDQYQIDMQPVSIDIKRANSAFKSCESLKSYMIILSVSNDEMRYKQ